jgi:hypothetical protein
MKAMVLYEVYMFSTSLFFHIAILYPLMCDTKCYKIIHRDTIFFAFKPLKSANCSKIYFIDYNIFNRHTVFKSYNLIEFYIANLRFLKQSSFLQFLIITYLTIIHRSGGE